MSGGDTYNIDMGNGTHVIKDMIMKDKKEALEQLKNCDEFYLMTYTDGEKAGIWNFEDYAKLVGCLSVAVDWFKREMMKKFK